MAHLPRWNSAECWSQAKPAHEANATIWDSFQWIFHWRMFIACALIVHRMFIVGSFLSVFGDEPLEKLPNRCLEAHSSLIGRCAKTPKDLEDRILICISHDLQSYQLPRFTKHQHASNNHSVSWIKAEATSIWLSPGNKTSKSCNKDMLSLDCRGRSYEKNMWSFPVPEQLPSLQRYSPTTKYQSV